MRKILSLTLLISLLTHFVGGSTIAHSANSDGCKDSTQALKAMDTESLSLINDHGKLVSISSYIADDHKKRAAGYQNICEQIIHHSSMIFVYSQPIQARFHMNNVKAPLDIGFFDGEGKLISVKLMQVYKNGNSELYSPNQSFQYAIEAREGFFKAHYLSPGKSRLIVYSLYDDE